MSWIATGLDIVWWTTLAGTVALYVACHVVPGVVVRWQSMPWTFQLPRNLDLPFQAVTYEAFHREPLSRGSHFLLVVEQVAWFVLLTLIHPALLVPAVGLLAWQAQRYGERRFALGLSALWAVLALTGWATVAWTGVAWSYDAARVLLMVAAGLRVVGHATEPVPPMLVESSDRFVPLGRSALQPRMLGVGLVGYLSEFASSLPFRLFPVQVYLMALDAGYTPEVAPDKASLARDAAAVHEGGWRAWAPTAALFEDEGLLSDLEHAA